MSWTEFLEKHIFIWKKDNDNEKLTLFFFSFSQLKFALSSVLIITIKNIYLSAMDRYDKLQICIRDLNWQMDVDTGFIASCPVFLVTFAHQLSILGLKASTFNLFSVVISWFWYFDGQCGTGMLDLSPFLLLQSIFSLNWQ